MASIETRATEPAKFHPARAWLPCYAIQPGRAEREEGGTNAATPARPVGEDTRARSRARRNGVDVSSMSATASSFITPGALLAFCTPLRLYRPEFI